MTHSTRGGDCHDLSLRQRASRKRPRPTSRASSAICCTPSSPPLMRPPRQPETADLKWQHHIMRASDGSHYVAFSVEPPATASLPAGPALLYLRLATATPAGAQRIAERSRDPGVACRQPDRSTAAAASAASPSARCRSCGRRRDRRAAVDGVDRIATSCKLMELRARTRAAGEGRSRQDSAAVELEGRASHVSRDCCHSRISISRRDRRAPTARASSRARSRPGPASTICFLAWADPSAPTPATRVRVVRKTLTLEPARTLGMITSSVILADSVSVRPAPYAPAEQASHPYSIGLMEIVPARTNRYAPREQSRRSRSR